MPSFRALVLAGALVTILSPVADAPAASPEPGDPVYHALRYSDDFTISASARR